MSVLARPIFLLLLFGDICSSNAVDTKEVRKGKYFLNLLGYFQGFKLGQTFGFQLTPIFYPQPIFVLPSINQQQSVNVQNGMTDENYQEMGGTIQMITPPQNKIKKTHFSQQSAVKPNEIDYQPNKREAKPHVLEHEKPTGLTKMRDNSMIDLTRQFNYTTESGNYSTTTSETQTQETTTIIPKTTTDTQIETTSDNLEEITVSETTGIYPDAQYNNSAVTNLTFTSASPIHSGRVDSTTSKRFNNSVDYNITMPVWKPVVWDPYPAEVNSIQGIESLSITTSVPHTNEALTPPFQEDRWMSFAISNKAYFPTSGGFKPLSGMYYDGFLHRPLRTVNF